MELKSMTKIRVVPLYDERRFAREMPNITWTALGGRAKKGHGVENVCGGGGGERSLGEACSASHVQKTTVLEWLVSEFERHIKENNGRKVRFHQG